MRCRRQVASIVTVAVTAAVTAARAAPVPDRTVALAATMSGDVIAAGDQRLGGTGIALRLSTHGRWPRVSGPWRFGVEVEAEVIGDLTLTAGDRVAALRDSMVLVPALALSARRHGEHGWAASAAVGAAWMLYASPRAYAGSSPGVTAAIAGHKTWRIGQRATVGLELRLRAALLPDGAQRWTLWSLGAGVIVGFAG